MDAATATTGRRAAQVLKKPRVFLPELATAGMVHTNEAVQRIVRHLADAENFWMFGAQIHYQASRAFVHVGAQIVDVAANDVEEVSVHAESLNDV